MVADDRSLGQLMAAAQAGDAVAYRTVLTESQRWLARYFARRIAPSAVDDLVQDTLASLHRKRATFDPARPFLPWLAAIARYKFVDHLRLAYRRAEDELSDEQLSAVDAEPAITARISLDRLFEELPPAQCRAIELVKIEGRSISEASAATGQSESLIKVNIHRGLKRLAALIEN